MCVIYSLTQNAVFNIIMTNIFTVLYQIIRVTQGDVYKDQHALLLSWIDETS